MDTSPGRQLIMVQRASTSLRVCRKSMKLEGMCSTPTAADAPTVAVLLYRKHVITQQPYLADLVRALEASGVKPVPIFINGVEAHTVVRDLLTTEHEQRKRDAGICEIDSLKPDACVVDAVVSTVGFPLVGGPAGSMEAGRQAEVAQAILTAKNVPYVVAAPLAVRELEALQAVLEPLGLRLNQAKLLGPRPGAGPSCLSSRAAGRRG